jgi:hypothetical protein
MNTNNDFSSHQIRVVVAVKSKFLCRLPNYNMSANAQMIRNKDFLLARYY